MTAVGRSAARQRMTGGPPRAHCAAAFGPRPEFLAAHDASPKQPSATRSRAAPEDSPGAATASRLAPTILPAPRNAGLRRRPRWRECPRPAGVARPAWRCCAAPGRQGRPGSFWAELPGPLKAATVAAVAPGPGLARRRRARSAVTMRWNQVQPRARSRLTCVSRPAIKIFFLSSFTLFAPAGE